MIPQIHRCRWFATGSSAPQTVSSLASVLWVSPAIGALLVWLLGSGLLAAQSHERDSDPLWRLGNTDCDLSQSQWKARVEVSPEGAREEAFDFLVGHGTELQLVCQIEPARVIPEWSVTLPVKSRLAGPRLSVRVVLPHSIDPDTGKRLTVLLPGSTISQPQEWTALVAGVPHANLCDQLRQAIWVLRQQYGKQVTDRDAYLDQLVLNAYGGPGPHQIRLGSPRFTGTVGAGDLAMEETEEAFLQDSAIRQVSLQEVDPRPAARITRDGTVFELDGQPFLPRIVQHNGEAFEFLKSLGFNVIQLPAAASDLQLLEAAQAEVWLICPPPPDPQAAGVILRHERVMAWNLGEQLAEQDTESIARRAREIRAADERAGRPLVAGASGNWAQLAQSLDALTIGQMTAGSTFPLQRYSDWIAACRETVGNAIPIWVDLYTEYPSAAVRQMGGLVGQLPPLPVEPQQLHFGLYEALAGGARGIRCLSRSRLDATDPQSRLRALEVEWLLRRLDPLEPWAAAGVVSGTQATGQERLNVTALKNNRATLLLVQQVTGWEQLVAGDSPLQTIRFVDSYSAISDRAYLLADYGLVPLSANYAPTGTDIQIDVCPPLAAVVLTQDPQIINRLSAQYDRAGGATLVNLHDQLTHQWFAIMQLIEGQVTRTGGGTSAASDAINEALRLVRQAETLLAAASPITATNYLDAADQQLAIVRRELLSRAGAGFRGLVSAPLLMHVSLLPLHWDLSGRASQLDWGPNGLGAGEFENLEQMVANGWENFRADDSQLQTLVELSPSAAVAGKTGLRLVAQGEQIGSGLVSLTPLKIVSGAVAVPAGKMVRIHGWVQIRGELQGAPEGLLVYDSLGGKDLGVRISKTDGWEEVILYRSAPEATSVRLTIQMPGTGEAWFDEFTLQTIDLPVIPPRTAENQGTAR